MKQNLYTLLTPADYGPLEDHYAELEDLLGQLRGTLVLEAAGRRTLASLFQFGAFSTIEKDIVEYYYNDVCFSTAMACLCCRYPADYGRKATGYYSDSAVNKITACWDYIFQVLAALWNTDLLATTKARKRLAMLYRCEWRVEGTSDKAHLVTAGLYGEGLNQANMELRKAMLSFNKKDIGEYIGPAGNFTVCAELDEMMGLFNSEAGRRLRTTREAVSHTASSGFSSAIQGATNTVPAAGNSAIASTPFGIEAGLLLDGIGALAAAVELLHRVVWQQKNPNAEDNNEEGYFLAELRCPGCKFEDSMVQTTYEFLLGHLQDNGFQCPECGNSLWVTEHISIGEEDHAAMLADIEQAVRQIKRYAKPPGEERINA